MLASIEDYRVELDAYAGPLDLLLYLVRRHEIDLHDIPIARLTEQYLAHVKLIQRIDVNLAGEFLVMAATLLEIKSAMLVPQAETDGDETSETQAATNPLDPRYELIQQLLAYKRFKDAAAALDQRREDWNARFPRAGIAEQATAARTVWDENTPEPTEEEIAKAIDIEDVHVLDLCEAFSRLMDSIAVGGDHKVVYDDTPIALHAEDILDRLQRDAQTSGGALSLRQIFEGRTSRSEMIGLFLATLELVRQRRVRVLQDRDAGDIRLELRPAEDQVIIEDKTADWRDPATGEVQYDWPSEETRKAAERRARLRAAWAAKKAAGEAVLPEELDAADETADEA